jgi:hypothetical protein
MKTFYSFFFILINTFTFSQEWEWTKIAGGPSIDKIAGITNDLTGNIFVTGFFDSIITFDSTRLISAGGTDIFIAKYDADGTLLWAKQVGGHNDDYSSGISTDMAGNCYITGSFYIQGNVITFGSTTISEASNADIFVAKFNATGNLIWLRNAGGQGDDASFSIATDISGNSYITGYFTGTALFGNTKVTSIGYSDVFVAKYSASGTLVWLKTGGGAYQDESYAISTDVTGNCYVTGHFTGNATFSGITLTSAGYFDTDVFILKYNPSGLLMWAKRAGGIGNDIGYGIDVDKNENVFVCGAFRGTMLFGDKILTRTTGSNGFIAKFDQSGKMLWSRNTNGSNLNEYRKVSADAEGNCYVTGSITEDVLFGRINIKSAGGKDACIVKYDSNGSLMWVLQGGGTKDDEGTVISSDAAGNCYVGGIFNAYASFGRLNFSGWLQQDIFISRIK